MRIPAILLAVFLAPALPAAAADFVNHADNKEQVLDGKRIQVANFWAAWCKPCRREMPEMSRWYTQKGKKQNVQMVGIAIDSAENVAKFLKETPVSYSVWRYTGKNSRAMMRAYGNTVGALPYTLVKNPACGAQQALLGEVDGSKLDAALSAVQKSCSAKK